MSAPPRVRWRLGPAGRRVFPLFLAAIRGEIEERPNAAERFDATPLGEVGAIHIVAVAQEDAEAERFPFGGRATEVDVEVIVRGGVPRQRPAHALSVRLDLGQRRAGHQGERHVARMEMGGVTDLVDEHGTAVAAGVWPAADARREHEVIQHELAAALEEVAQPRRTFWAGEYILLLDPRHRLAAPLRREFVPGARS